MTASFARPDPDPYVAYCALYEALQDAIATGDHTRIVAVSHQLPPLRAAITAERDHIRWAMPTAQQQRPEVIARYEDLEWALWPGYERRATREAGR